MFESAKFKNRTFEDKRIKTVKNTSGQRSDYETFKDNRKDNGRYFFYIFLARIVIRDR